MIKMALLPGFLVFGFVVAVTVSAGDGARRPMDFSFLRQGNPMQVRRGGARALESGGRGVIGNDLSWMAMLPLRVIEFFVNVPIYILRTISQLTNDVLRHLLGVEATEMVDLVTYIMLFPLTVLYWVLSVPVDIFWFFISIPFRAFAFVMWIGGSILDFILKWLTGSRYNYNQVKMLNKFLSADIFGPLGNGIEDLIEDVVRTFQALWGWIFSSSQEAPVKRQQLFSALSSAVRHMSENMKPPMQQ